MKIIYRGAEPDLIEEEKIESIIKIFCNNLNLKDCKPELIRGGQTNAAKIVLKGVDGAFFIKIGEKVDQEKEVYEKINFKDKKLFLQIVECKGLPSGVLVLPFYDGINLDDYVFCTGYSNSQIFGKLEQVLNLTSSNLWLRNYDYVEQSDSSVNPEKYIDSHIAPLYSEIKVESNDKVYTFKEFLDLKVLYEKQGEQVKLPTIREMILVVLDLFQTHPVSYFGSTIGDFQPSNIIINEHDFKIIDLSNGLEGGDIALDVGKFFNFLNRFHRVALLRDHKINKNFGVDLKVDVYKDQIMVNFLYQVNNQFENLVCNLEEKFTKSFAMQTHDYYFSDRVKLYKFVINIITLRRHIGNKELVDLLFLNIIDSYLEVMKKVKSI
jgi:hypothetical protein